MKMVKSLMSIGAVALMMACSGQQSQDSSVGKEAQVKEKDAAILACVSSVSSKKVSFDLLKSAQSEETYGVLTIDDVTEATFSCKEGVQMKEIWICTEKWMGGRLPYEAHIYGLNTGAIVGDIEFKGESYPLECSEAK